MADPVTIRVAVGWGLSAVGWVVSPIIAKLLNKGFSYLGIDGAEKLKDGAEKLKELETKLLELEELLMEANEESLCRNELEKLLPNLRSAIYEAEDILDDVENYCLEKLVLSQSDSKSVPSKIRNWVKKLHSALPKSSHPKKGQDDVAAPFWNDRRVQITPSPGSVLAPLRRLSPRRADLSRAHAPRDIAWSIARLILDSGATSHAVGNICLLEGFQPYNPPLLATLADGRNLRILGIGRIERGNFSIPNVELVEGLQDGLISVRQLDREHGLISCFGNGICRIMLADGTEVGGAFVQDADSLYVLRYLEVPGP